MQIRHVFRFSIFPKSSDSSTSTLNTPYIGHRPFPLLLDDLKLLSKTITMAKKEKSKALDANGISLNKTAKFSTLDAPGVSQPDLSSPVSDADPAASAVATSKAGVQGRRANASSGPRIDTSASDKGVSIGGDSFVKRTPNPTFLKARTDVYDQVKARRSLELSSKVPVPITVTMPDGKVFNQTKDGTPLQAWVTTPMDVAQIISQGLADASTVARVTYESFVDDYSPFEDGMEAADMLLSEENSEEANDAADTKVFLWDMSRPLVGPVAKLELLKFTEDTDAKTVFWHSSAHMMGEALEHLYGCKLTIGPPLAGGFYYDSFMGTDAFREEDCKSFTCDRSFHTM
jgi:TGS domain